MTSPTCLATFHTNHQVIKAEQAVKKHAFDVRAVSVPRTFSSDCGIGLRFPQSLRNRIIDILKEKAIEPAHVYDE